jgi:hypothetical protein
LTVEQLAASCEGVSERERVTILLALLGRTVCVELDGDLVAAAKVRQLASRAMLR